MSLKGQKTKSQPLDWNALTSLILKLERDGDIKTALYIALSIYTGLRCGDVLTIKWCDVINQDYLVITEQKTKKSRNITINNNLKEILTRCWSSMNITEPSQQIFLNRFGKKVITIQYLNRHLKDVMDKYKVVPDSSVIKTHSMRKSFGKKVFLNSDSSELGLILLSQIFQHSSPSITIGYIGLTEKNIGDAYLEL
jgi:integrase